MQERRDTEVSLAPAKCKIPVPSGRLPVPEHDFRTSYRGSPAKRPGVTPVPPRARARAHLPNRQELRLSGKCAPSSPLRLMVTRRAEDAMVRPAEGGVASR